MIQRGLKLSLLLACVTVRLATAATDPAVAVSQAVQRTAEKRWSASLLQTARTSSVESSDETKSTGLDTELTAAYKISSLLKADIYTAWSKDLSGMREVEMQNTVLRLDQTPMKLNKYLNTRGRLSLTIPTNEVERTEAGLRTAAAFDQRLLFNTPVFGLGGFFAGTFSKNFHRYDLTFEGQPLISHALSGRLVVNYEFIESFYAEVSPRLTQRWDYQGAPSASFGLYQELGWSKGAWTVALGHNNEGNLFQENGRESNFTIDSAATGSYYLTLGVTL